MPVKIARSAPRPSFGLPELLVAIQPRVSLAARPESANIYASSGVIRGIPVLDMRLRFGGARRFVGQITVDSRFPGRFRALPCGENYFLRQLRVTIDLRIASAKLGIRMFAHG
jgi:hypothetical protein